MTQTKIINEEDLGINILKKKSIEEILKSPLVKEASYIKFFLPNDEDSLEFLKKRVLELSKSALEEIFLISKEKRSFENTLMAFDKACMFFSIFSSVLSLVKNTYTQKEMREKATEIKNTFSKFYIENFSGNRRLYGAIQDYLKGNKKDENLNAEQSYYLEDLVRDFKQAGFHLEKKEFEKVKELKKELALLSADFSKNVNNDTSHIIVSKEELKGASADFLSNLQEEKSKYVVKTDYPSYFHVMENAEIEETRRKLYLAFNNRAHPQNDLILKKVIELRFEMSNLLGYENFSCCDLDGEMAKNPQVVHQFIDDLLPRVKEKAVKEFKELKSNLPEGISLKGGSFKPWDLAYISNQFKKSSLNVDEKSLSEYFPLEGTLKGLFDIYEKFFGFEFILKDEKLWHSDVRLLEVKIKGSPSESLGFVALDLFPREGKYTHACSCAICPPLKIENKWQGALNLVIANFTKPTKGKPSLLMFNEVNTFFHEMGHALHALSGRALMPTLAGYHTRMDFVELPSQILEEWLWEKDILKGLSQHYKTKEPIEDILLDKKIASKSFDSGRHTLRQLILTKLSLKLFESGDSSQVGSLFKKLSSEMNGEICFEKENHFESAFGHLMGYGAKYYSYLWAKVFALDIFSEIKRKDGLLKSSEGKKYFDKILSKGGGVDPNDLIQDYLGRKPSQDAFISDLGIDI
jgi:thimet oligopeptidase